MSYETEHASALADVRAAGVDVVFTKTVKGAYDASTNTFGPDTVTTVTGAAVRTKGDPKKYAALNLIESEAPTLLFVADTYGDTPPLESAVDFGGNTYRVRDVDPLAPDGTAIFTRAVVAR